MFIVPTLKIKQHERGWCYRDREFSKVLNPGRHWFFGLPWKTRVERVSVREVEIRHDDLEVFAKSGVLEGQALVLDLKDHERALIWIDGRFAQIRGPGLHAFWTVFNDVRGEVVDASEVLFEHPSKNVILKAAEADSWLEQVRVDPESSALLFIDGEYRTTLTPGTYALWKGLGRYQVVFIDRREQVLDISGQDIMTADKVTLRLNAQVAFRVTDPLVCVQAVDDYRQSLYREAQMALRAVIGGRDLDPLLADKSDTDRELDELVRRRASDLGLEVLSVGIRDLILPGEMRLLMNQVTEAKKAAEANLIARREETAAMRSQANTAKILESNPTLMKLRELEVLEKVADKANLNVVLTESGLSDRMLKLV